jgi:hypothetical protein
MTSEVEDVGVEDLISWSELFLSSENFQDCIIGRGAFSIVFRALYNGVHVAVKIILKNLVVQNPESYYEKAKKNAFEEYKRMKRAENVSQFVSTVNFV